MKAEDVRIGMEVLVPCKIVHQQNLIEATIVAVEIAYIAEWADPHTISVPRSSMGWKPDGAGCYFCAKVVNQCSRDCTKLDAGISPYVHARTADLEPANAQSAGDAPREYRRAGDSRGDALPAALFDWRNVASSIAASFWMVYRIDGTGPTYRHPSEKSARGEAERLARGNPGSKFLILRALGEVWVPKAPVTYVEFLTDDEIPF